MEDCVAMVRGGNSVSVCIYNAEPALLELGEKMNALCDEAYMNGYNWEAFLRFYLQENAPALLEDLTGDPEADMCALVYPLTPEGAAKAERLAETIRALLAEEEALYRVLREHGDEIEWD